LSQSSSRPELFEERTEPVADLIHDRSIADGELVGEWISWPARG
jgi:hypothetical protein